MAHVLRPSAIYIYSRKSQSLVLFSDNDDRGHLVILAHRIVEEDKTNGGFIDRHSLRHSQHLDIDVVAIDNGCRNSILLFYMLTELVRLAWSDHGELVKWRHSVWIETVYFRNSMSSEAVEISASSKEPGESSKDHREKYSSSSGLHDCNLHFAGM